MYFLESKKNKRKNKKRVKEKRKSDQSVRTLVREWRVNRRNLTAFIVVNEYFNILIQNTMRDFTSSAFPIVRATKTRISFIIFYF